MNSTSSSQATFTLKIAAFTLLMTVMPQLFAQDNKLTVSALTETGSGYLYEFSLKNSNGHSIEGQLLSAKGGGETDFCVTGSSGTCTLNLAKGLSADDLVVQSNDEVLAYQFNNALDQKRPAGISDDSWVSLSSAVKAAVQEDKMNASDADADDFFGYSVSLNGDRVLVGAYQDDEYGNEAGAAYVFDWSGTNWQQSAKISASDADDFDWFGYSVSLSGDTALVGAWGNDDAGISSGSAYIFEFNGTSWVQSAKLTASDAAFNDRFGISTSLHNNKALIGAHLNDDTATDSGSAYVFEFNGSNWVQSSKLLASDAGNNDQFGITVSIYNDFALIGSPRDDDFGGDSGSAYLFNFNGVNWVQYSKLNSSDAASLDYFGNAVSLYADRLLIGAVIDDDNGISSGSAYIFENNLGVWNETAKLLASDGSSSDYFGVSVSLSSDRAIVGAYWDDDNGSQSGSSYVFDYDGTTWFESAKLIPSDGMASDYFGYSVSLSNDRAIIGSYLDDDSAIDSGSIYEFNVGLNNNSVAEIGTVGDKVADGNNMDANSFHLFEATVLDGSMVAVQNAVVTFAATPDVKFGSAAVGAAGTCTTGVAGTCTVIATSTVAGSYMTAVSVGGEEVSTGSPLSFNFVAGPATAANSDVDVTDSPATAGSAGVTITVTARDAFNNLVDNADVSYDFAATAAVSIGGGLLGDAGSCAVLDANDTGQCSVTATSQVAGDYSTAVSLGVDALNDGPALYTFVPDMADAAQSTFDVAISSSEVNNPVAINAMVNDQYGNAVADGTAVYFNTDFGTLNAGSCMTTSGECGVSVNSTLIGTSNITVSLTEPAPESANKAGFGSSEAVTWTAAAPAASESTYEVDMDSQEVGQLVTYSALVEDAFGNPVADNIEVTFTLTDSNGAVTPATVTCMTGADVSGSGACSATATSEPVGDTAVTASTVASGNFSSASGFTSTNWTPAAPAAATSSYQVNNDSSEVAQNVTYSAVVRDQYDNPVNDNIEVTFALTDSNGAATPASVTCMTSGGGCSAMATSNLVGDTSVIASTVASGNFALTSGFTSTNWTPAAAAASNSTYEVDTDSSTVGQDVTYSAVVQDAYTNSVANDTLVTFTLTDSNGAVTPATVTCMTNGGACSAMANSELVGDTSVMASTAASGNFSSASGFTSTNWIPAGPAAATSSYEVNLDSQTVGQNVTYSAQVNDTFGNAVADGVEVTFNLSNTNGATAPGSVTCMTTGGTGTCSATANSEKVGDTSVIASTVATGAFNLTPGNTSTNWTPDVPSAANSFYGVSDASITAGQDVTYSAQVFDQFDNAVADNTTVTFALNNNNGATAPGSVMCDTTGGSCDTTATSTKVGDTSVVASAGTGDFTNLIAMQGNTTMWTTGPADANTSTVIASTNGAVANGVAQNVLEATVVDANDNPVVGQLVTFAAPVTDVTFVGGNSTCITGVDGVCTVSVTSTVAGDYSTAVSISAGDIDGSPVQFTFVPGPADPTQSNYSVDLASQTVGQDVTYSVVIRDAFMNPVNDQETVNFTLTNSAGVDAVLSSMTCTTGAGGTCTVNPTASSTKVGTTSVVADIGGPDLSNPNAGITSTTWTVDVADAAQSSVTVTLDDQSSNDADELQATILDQFDNPVENQTVFFSQPVGATIDASCVTLANGQCTVNASSTTAGTYTTNVTLFAAFESMGAEQITNSPIDFTIVADAADNGSSTVAVTDDGATADGADSVTLTATITDNNGNAVGGELVTFAGHAALSYDGSPLNDDGTCTTNAVGSAGEGTCSVSVTTTVAGKYSQAVSIGGDLSNSPAVFTFVAGAADPEHSAITNIGPDVTANGSDTIEITVEVRDAFNNLVGGSDVTFEANAALTYAGSAEGVLGSCSTAAIDFDNPLGTDGICSITVTSEVAADYMQTVEVDGAVITAIDSPTDNTGASPASFTFEVGMVDADESTFSVSDATVVAGSQVSYSADIRDEFSNPISGMLVDFTMTNTATAESGSSVATTPNVSCTTDVNGLCSIETTSYKTGQTEVDAEADGVTINANDPMLITTAWTPGLPSTFTSEYAVNTATETVGNDVVYTATIRDSNMNLVGGGVQVDFTMNNTDANTPDGSCTTTADLPFTGQCAYNATSEQTTFDSMGSTQVTAEIVGFGVVDKNILFDESVTPDAIFGSGNSKENFTVQRDSTIELSLKAKVPFGGPTNSNGDGTYSYTIADLDYDNDPMTVDRWNFEWSVNTDFDDSSGNTLDDYTYELGLDSDPGMGVNYIAFDPITPSATVPFFTHYIGDNMTGNGAGSVATDALDYADKLSTQNVLQQSWSYAFNFLSVPLGYDPNNPILGNYSIYMLMRDSSGTVVARTEIQVLIGGAAAVEEPLDTTTWLIGDPAEATLSVDTDSQIANGTDQNVFSVSVTDEFSNPISGQSVTFSTDAAVTLLNNPCSTDDMGMCSIQATSTTAGTYGLDATVDGFASVDATEVNFEFVSGPADAAQSTVTNVTSGAIADGSFNNISVEVLDAQGNSVEGEIVTFAADPSLTYEGFGLGNEGTCTTDVNGVCDINVSSLVATDYSQSVTISDGELISSPANFAFIAGPPAGATSEYAVNDVSQVVTNNVTYSTVVRDANNNLVADGNLVTFNLQNSNGANVGGVIDGATTVTCTTGSAVSGSGACSVSATSMKVGDTSIVSVSTASSGGFANVGNDSTNWTPGAASAANSEIVVSNSPATADLVDEVTLTAIIRDANDNLVTSTDTVTFTQPGDITLSSLTCNANDSGLGQCSVNATTSKASTYISAASLVGGNIDTNINYEFVAGPVDFTKSFVTVLTDNAFANGTALNELEASLFDQFFNPVKNTEVAFAATPDVNFGIGSGVARTCNTGQAGSCSMFASSVLQGTYTTAVTVSGTPLFLSNSDPVTYTFVDGDVDITTSTVTASLPAVDANGVDASIISVQLRDSLNNVLTSGTETVALSGMPASAVIGPVSFDAMTNTYDFDVTNINVDFVEFAATVEIGGMPMPIDDKATVDFQIIDIDGDNLHDPEDPDTANTDTDGDGINDGADATPNGEAMDVYPDNDGDGIRDRADVDVDGDGNDDNGSDFDGDGINDEFDLDSVNPIITVIGGDVSVEQGTNYNDLGATALDNQSGDITSDIVVTFEFDDGINPPIPVMGVDTSTIGVYTIFYNVSDIDGNPALEKQRTATVTVDATIPVITLTGDDPVTFEAGDLYVDEGATGFDSFDLGGNTVTSDIDSVLDPIPGGHTSLVPDTYTITYALVDAAGNMASPVTRSVIVEDTTAPVITLTGDAVVNVEQGNAFVDDGATATDLVDGNLTGSIIVTGSVDINTVGQYVLSYDVMDAAGNMAITVIRTVNVTADTVPPVITLNGVTPDSVVEGGVYNDPGASALDNIDGAIPVVVTGSVDTATPGFYQLQYNATDAAGNDAVEVVRDVEVTADAIIPVITLLGNASESIERGGSYVDAGATASDNIQGDITGDIVTVNPVDTSVVGMYTVSYNVSDNRGNAAVTVTRSVEVTPDVTVPVISQIGGDVTIEQWSAYVDQGATALDNFDGDITANIVAVSNVDTSIVGNYMVTYDVSDSSGNPAATVTRMVTVTPDITTPVINLIGDNPQTIEAGDAYTELGANVIDNEPGLTVNINSSDVDTSEPGNYIVFYNVTDSAGNVASTVIRTVTVVDTTAPVIQLLGNNPQVIEAGDAYNEAGANIIDNEAGLTVIIDDSDVDTNIPGDYVVTYDVTDSAGNSAIQVVRDVEVVDTTAPVITVLGDNPLVIQELEPYVEAGAEATDFVDDDATLTAAIVIDDSAVDIQSPGIYQVTYTVSDNAGNQTVETRTVEVTADIPVVQNDSYEVNEDVQLVANDVDGSSTMTTNDDSVLVNDNDPDSDGLTVLEVGNFTAGGIGGDIEMFANGTFNYNPPADVSGLATFDFTVSDGTHDVASSLSINVLPVNDAPDFDLMGDVDVTGMITSANPSISLNNFADNFIFGPADESSQSVEQFNITTMDSNGIIDNIEINPNGQLSIDFNLVSGVAVVQVTMQDDGGTDNGGTDTSTIKEFVVTSLDFIFVNGFELDGQLMSLFELNTLSKFSEVEIYEDGFSFEGHWLNTLRTSDRYYVTRVLELWMIEILKFEQPDGDFDNDGILNFEDDVLN